jgi:tRNA(adenine34) deaminase
METDENWMSCAIAAAAVQPSIECIQMLDVPIGCVIVHEGKQIATAQNSRQAQNDPVGHAEILALRQAAAILKNWRLLDCTVYVTLEPCAMCAEAMIQSRVKRVVFGAYDSIAGAAGSRFNLFVKREAVLVPEVSGGICEAQCRTLIQDFFRTRRLQNLQRK